MHWAQQHRRQRRLGLDTHLMTSHRLLPLLVAQPGGVLVEITDGTAEYTQTSTASRCSTTSSRSPVNRLAYSQGHELAPHHAMAVAVTPGWLRSEMMLDNYGVEEGNWREALAPNRTDGYPPDSRTQ